MHLLVSTAICIRFETLHMEETDKKAYENIQLSHSKPSHLVTLILQKSYSAYLALTLDLRSAKILSHIRLIMSHLDL